LPCHAVPKALRYWFDCALSVTYRKHFAQMFAGECLRTQGCFFGWGDRGVPLKGANAGTWAELAATKLINVDEMSSWDRLSSSGKIEP
jgi:hypothetical protein